MLEDAFDAFNACRCRLVNGSGEIKKARTDLKISKFASGNLVETARSSSAVQCSAVTSVPGIIDNTNTWILNLPNIREWPQVCVD